MKSIQEHLSVKFKSEAEEYAREKLKQQGVFHVEGKRIEQYPEYYKYQNEFLLGKLVPMTIDLMEATYRLENLRK